LTRFAIIRHGETIWNREQRIQGQRNSVLSPAGELQAHATARRLRDVPFTRLVSSDLGRTLQTAAPIVSATGLALETDRRLRERCFGVFEGMTRAEIEVRHAEAYAHWQGRDPHYAMQDGESLNGLCVRVRECLESIAAQTPGRVIVVTHGGVLDAVYRIAANLALDAPRTWRLLNSSINEIEITAGKWRLLEWGDVGHLAATDDDIG
jgi:probable phosphoglycerate mutase